MYIEICQERNLNLTRNMNICYIVHMYVVKTSRKRADGSHWEYYVIRNSEWDGKAKKQIHRYVGYVGTTDKVTLKRAREICKNAGLTLKDLRKVSGLVIIED